MKNNRIVLVSLNRKTIKLINSIGINTSLKVKADLKSLRLEEVSKKKKVWMLTVEADNQFFEVPLDGFRFSREQKEMIHSLNKKITNRDFYAGITKNDHEYKTWWEKFFTLMQLRIPLAAFDYMYEDIRHVRLEAQA